MKNVIKVILFNIFLFLLLCFVGELILRIFYPNSSLYIRTSNSKNNGHSFETHPLSWVKEDKDIGWVAKQFENLKFSNPILNRRDVSYIINKQGFRNSKDYNRDVSSNAKVMLLGDSYLFGVYLNEDQTICSNLQKIFMQKINFYNFGIPGWGLDQMLLAYKKYNDIINPQVIIVLYIDDNILRVLETFRVGEKIEKPSFELVNGKLSKRTDEEKNILIKIMEKSFLLNKFYKRYMEYEPVQISNEIFNELIALTKQRKQKLVIVRIPYLNFILEKNEMGRFDVSELFHKEDISYIDLNKSWLHLDSNSVKKYYLRNDSHLSELGSKYISELIEKQLNGIYK